MGKWYSASARELLRMTGSPDPSAAMRQCACQLLDEVEVTTPPINLRMVASFQGVRAIQPVVMVHAGRLVPKGSGYIIQVNAHHSNGKQQFTIGHEIGHTLIPSYQKHPHLIEDLSTGLFQQGKEEEHLCDIAATELLMPTQLFRPQAAALGFHLGAVAKLGSLFRASREATARRLVEMDLWPCASAVWHLAYKPSEAHIEDQLTFDGPEWAPQPKKLRLRYCVANSHFGHYLYPNLAASAEGCVMRCFTEGNVVCGEDRIIIRNQEIPLYVMAAPVDFISEAGSTREVLSLLLSDGAAPVARNNHPALWSMREE